MSRNTDAEPNCAYEAVEGHAARFRSSLLTRGPWHPDHQHAGPPTALACRAIERAALDLGFAHVSRLTVNLLRPVPIVPLDLDVATDYAGRNAAHFSARLIAGGKEVARLTALVQREGDLALPAGLPGHPAALAPLQPEASPPITFPFAGRHVGYADLVETRLAQGRFFTGPCAVWFRLRHPLLAGESPSPYQRVAVAADSGNGISAILEFSKYTFINLDLTVNLLRRPEGEWICLDARTQLGPRGCGLALSTLFDEKGLVGTATQSLSVRPRGDANTACTAAGAAADASGQFAEGRPIQRTTAICSRLPPR
jgi:hypothetical protein